MRDWVCAKMLLIIIHVITYIMHELTGSGHCNFIWIVQCSLKVLLISTVKILVVFIKLWKATWERVRVWARERQTYWLIIIESYVGYIVFSSKFTIIKDLLFYQHSAQDLLYICWLVSWILSFTFLQDLQQPYMHVYKMKQINYACMMSQVICQTLTETSSAIIY